MHMADALLSPAVGITMSALSLGAIAYSTVKMDKDELTEKKLPLMAISGAFVFAAQMINFTIPGTGSSGHIGGGIMLAGLLGGGPAAIVLTAVLLIQALFFADGGLLALGANVFNMAIIPCLVIYPLIFKPMLKKGLNKKNITLASIISVVVGLQLGAFGVVLETLASGVTELPFSSFVILMQPIHLAIGLVEGLITAAMLCFVHSARPEIIDSTISKHKLEKSTSLKKVVIVLSVVTLLVGGGLSLFASAFPDGLEWSMEKVAGTAELETTGEIFETTEAVQSATAFMPDYNFKDSEESAVGTSTAGIIGCVITFAVAGLTGVIITMCKRKNKLKNG